MIRQQTIEQVIQQQIQPVFLSIENESNRHHVPPGSETHFKVVAVSEKFTAMSRIDRHRLINNLLADEFNQGLHALSLHLFSPEEWKEKRESSLNSPACRDGFRHG